MSEHRRNQSPIVRFLGEDAGQGGPFALLGLRHEIGSDTEIQRARLRRLRQVDCHPQRATPDADEVRLAIHSAASQLLDEALRSQLAIRWPEGTPVDVPKAWTPTRAMHRVTPALMRRARLIVGSSGGWNASARRRLAHLARINRLNAMEIVQQLGAGTSSRTSPDGSTRSFPMLPPAPGGSGGWFIAYALLGVLACTTAITLIIVPNGQGKLEVADETGPITLNDYTEPDTRADTGSTVQRDRITHYSAIAHELDRLVARARVEPDAAVARFREIYPQFTREWTAFPRNALQRAGVNIAEFMVRLDQQGLSPEQISPLLAAAGVEPGRVMLATSVIDVTLNSAGLRQETMDQLRAIRTQMSDAPVSNSSDLSVNVQVIASHLGRTSRTDDPGWWTNWHTGVENAVAEGTREHTAIILGAMSRRLRDPREPDQQWRSVASRLVRSLDWRPSSAERFWLIEQFSDRSVTTPRLAMLTEALVTESAAEGVDQLMILRRDANDPKRDQIQSRIKSAWFPNQSMSASEMLASGSMTPLMQQLRVEINATPDQLDDDRAIDPMLRLARLVTAAHLQLDGAPELGEEIIASYDEPISEDTPERSSLARTDSDTQWAEKAVNCTEPEQLRPYLDELIGKRTIGISSAYALVHLANRADANLRELAIEQITRFGDQVTMLIAVDHELDTRPSAKLEAIVYAALQTELPSRNDSDWLPVVRRIVLARIGDAIADERAIRVSQLQQEVSELHALRLDILRIDLGTEPNPAAQLAAITNSTRSPSLQGASSPQTRAELNLIETRATIERANAHSLLHAYLAEQRFQLGLICLDLLLRYPDAEQVLDAIISELEDRDARASSVLQQITQAQRAIAQMTLVELEREAYQ